MWRARITIDRALRATNRLSPRGGAFVLGASAGLAVCAAKACGPVPARCHGVAIAQLERSCDAPDTHADRNGGGAHSASPWDDGARMSVHSRTRAQISADEEHVEPVDTEHAVPCAVEQNSVGAGGSPVQEPRGEFKIRFKLNNGKGVSSGVGIGVFVTSPAQHPGCVLLGRRRGSDGAGTWALPGGHLEYLEDFTTCAARETMEETGLSVKNVRFGTINNARDASVNYHYVTIFMVCEVVDDRANPLNLEPNKCDGWEWIRWDRPDFPQPLFTALKNAREAGYSPFQRALRLDAQTGYNALSGEPNDFRIEGYTQEW